MNGDFTGKYVMGTCRWGVETAKDLAGRLTPGSGRSKRDRSPQPSV
jgi:hypothetical protein